MLIEYLVNVVAVQAFNIRELSDLHELVYLAGVRLHNQKTNQPSEAKQVSEYMERKKREHQEKVRELQHQLCEIKNGLTAIRDLRCFCTRSMMQMRPKKPQRKAKRCVSTMN